MNDVDIYINFVVHVVFGRLREADVLMSMAGDAIRSVAAYLTMTYPFEVKPVYRALLLDPALPFRSDPGYKFLSWTEDRDVAAWFSCRRSTISQVASATNTRLRGYIVTLPEPSSRVLFHFSWGRLFGPGLARLARLNPLPLMGEEAARQLTWSLQVQSEVVTDPVDGLEPVLVDELDDKTLAALEKRFNPPWIL